jgi:L-lysine 2,3-aminomutase
VNDSVSVLSALSTDLFALGILPYYLHLLDKVSSAEHFLVEDETATKLHRELGKKLSGYLVPRLVALFLLYVQLNLVLLYMYS